MVEGMTYKSRAEWLKARRPYLGGSEAACVLGLNPYKTNVQLWEEKMGLAQPADISGNPLVQYGSQAERYLRELFMLDFPSYGLWYVANNMFRNTAYPWAHASVDGLLKEMDTGRSGVLEIKTATVNTSAQREKWNDRVPDSYYVQVLHYMAVLELDFAVIKAQLKTDYDGNVRLETRHYKIERGEVDEDIKMLMDAERDFTESIKQSKRPALILPRI